MKRTRGIAKILGVSLETAIKTYTKPRDGKGISLKTRPCPFLAGDECSIYPSRPKVCRAFPVEFHRNTLGFYEYCKFAENLLVNKALGYLMRGLLEREHPELKEALDSWADHVEKSMPEDPEGRLLYVRKLMKDLESRGE